MASCRICFDSYGPLYHPCKCDGSVKYVHEACLFQWINTRSHTRHSCELCKEPYSIEYDNPIERDILAPPHYGYFILNPAWHISLECMAVILLNVYNPSYSIETYHLIAHIVYHTTYLMLYSLYIYCAIKQKQLYFKYLYVNSYYPFIISLHFMLLGLNTTLYLDQYSTLFVLFVTFSQCYLGIYPLIHSSILYKMNQGRTLILKNRNE